MQFSETAEEMHANAGEFDSRAEFEAMMRNDFLREIEKDFDREIGIVPPSEYGSLESRENAWAHAVLTGGE